MGKPRSLNDIKSHLLDTIVQEPNTGCFLWTKNCDKDGYGKVYYKNKHWRAHRLSFHIFKNNVKTKDLVCHKCDTPSCINPEHLFIGTPLLNMRDKVKKGRLKNQHMNKTHCKNGHIFNEKNTLIFTNKDKKKRACKICYVKSWKERNKRKSLNRKRIKKLSIVHE